MILDVLPIKNQEYIFQTCIYFEFYLHIIFHTMHFIFAHTISLSRHTQQSIIELL